MDLPPDSVTAADFNGYEWQLPVEAAERSMPGRCLAVEGAGCRPQELVSVVLSRGQAVQGFPAH